MHTHMIKNARIILKQRVSRTEEKPVHGRSTHTQEGNMRKTAMVLVIILFLQSFIGIGAFAATNIVEKPIDGTITKVAYTQGAGTAGNLVISAEGAVIANRELWEPDATHSFYRLIVDLKNTYIGTPGILVVNKGKVLQVRYSQFDAIRSRFVIDISEKPTYAVKASASQVDIEINGGIESGTPTPSPSAVATVKPKASATAKASAPPTGKASASPTVKAPVAPTPKPNTSTTVPPTPSVKPIPVSGAVSPNSALKGPLSWTMSGDTCVLKIDNTNISALTAQGIATVENRGREKTIQITLKGMDPRFVSGAMSGNKVLYGVLVSQNELRKTTTIRLSGKTPLAYTMENSGTHTILRIKSNGTAVEGTATSGVKAAVKAGMAISGGPTASVGTVSSGVTAVSEGIADTDGSTALPVLAVNTSTSRSASRTLPVQISATTDSVTVTSADISLSRVYRMGKNVIIEVPGVAAATSLNIGSLLVKDVSGISVDGRVKLVVSTGVMTDWMVTETAGKLVVRFTAVDITNLEGGDDADVVLRITGQDIVSRYRAAIDQIIVDDDLQLSAFTYIFPLSVVRLGDGVVKTNDMLSNGISTLMTGQSSFLSIAKRNGDTQFKLVEEADGNTLTIRKSIAEAPVAVPNGAPRLVVLDAGHGGMDPGTVFEGVYESSVNLDITLRAEAILKQRGIKVVLTRSSDVFVGLDERCSIANNAGASLFVSIHQNSMPDPATRGTMTLYYASSVNGKHYAEIMQQTLVSAVGLGSLGLRTSSGLVVLRKTKMPAILTEAGCMSNVQDMQLIKTEPYRQTAATAIADGIEKILATMD